MKKYFLNIMSYRLYKFIYCFKVTAYCELFIIFVLVFNVEQEFQPELPNCLYLRGRSPASFFAPFFVHFAPSFDVIQDGPNKPSLLSVFLPIRVI